MGLLPSASAEGRAWPQSLKGSKNSPQRTQRNEKIAGEKTINFYSGFEPNLCVLCGEVIFSR
jgi:hypothetical protein